MTSFRNSIMSRACLRACIGASLCIAASASADKVELVSPNEEASGSFGVSVSGIPDVNGDGHGDVIVGADAENAGGQTDSGRVYIFSGKTGLLIRSHSSPNPEFDGSFGISVAGVRDINGDGRGDYVVGAMYESPGGLNRGGRVYVYSGATGALIRTHVSPNNESGGTFGWSVAAIPDLNNDGRGDYMVGAPGENGAGQNDSGRVYVYSGINGALIRTHTSPNAEFAGNYGWSVAGIPDVSGDNRGDYVIGAPAEDPGSAPIGAGRAYIYSGTNGTLIATLASPNQETSGAFGRSVGGIPDVNGNGRGDVIVGARFEDPGSAPESAGRAYIFNGTNGALLRTLVSPGEQASGMFGSAVAGMPDHDGDGFGDVIVGAEHEGNGRAYIMSGATGSHISTINVNGSTAEQLGASVAGVPDVNGDGLGDAIAGGHTGEGPGQPFNSGRAYLYRYIPNDLCNLLLSDMPELEVGSTPFTTIGATEGAAETNCAFGDAGPDIWFTHHSSCTGTMSVTTCNAADFNTQIAIYQGCSFSLPLFACNLGAPLACDSAGPITCLLGTNGVSLQVQADSCYFIRIGGDNNAYGTGTVTLSYTNCVNCEGDLNGDNTVNGADLGLLLADWGGNGPADLNNDGTINGADLGLLLAAWGPC